MRNARRRSGGASTSTTVEENRLRHEIQQPVWRRGRGEETELWQEGGWTGQINPRVKLHDV